MQQDFVSLVIADRDLFGPPSHIRELSEEFSDRCLALLFPHFSRDQFTAPEPVAEIDALCDVLRRAIGPLLEDAETACEIIRRHVLEALPLLRAQLLDDADAILSADPAASSLDEVILAYPGFYALAIYRIAHIFYEQEIPLFPRLLSEYAHRQTGIDLHPGAKIGQRFSIDHGTGVVIGETAVIGDRVRIFQGVTLGALSVKKKLEGTKRHPTIGNDVVIYSQATILGGRTVIGEGSIIGGNVWLTDSVPPHSVITNQAANRHTEWPDFVI